MMLTDLATAVRRSGLDVVEVDGWRTRGHGSMSAVDAIVCHHTATSRQARGDYPSLGIVRDGRPDLAGPLAQLGLGRSGTVYVIAAGVSFHAGAVRDTWMDNWHAIGIEAEHDGLSAWPDRIYDAYGRLVAALRDYYDVPLTRVLGHKEVCSPPGRKSDPNFDMDTFRERVRNTEEDDMFTEADRTMLREAHDAAVRGRKGAYQRDKLEQKLVKRLRVDVRELRKALDELDAEDQS